MNSKAQKIGSSIINVSENFVNSVIYILVKETTVGKIPILLKVIQCHFENIATKVWNL